MGSTFTLFDTRKPETFAQGFIPNSTNIGIDGNFAPWVGTLIPDLKQQILIVSEDGREEEVVTRLSRVGYDYTIGYLKGGFEAWKNAGKETDTIASIPATELEKAYQQNKNIKVVDVRKQSEFQAEHVESASNAPLDFLNQHLAEIPKNETVYLHCAGGYRSMIAASILKARGYDNLVNVEGGFKDISATSIPKTAYVCPSTLK